MCIAILTMPGVRVPHMELRQAFLSNGDGAGMMFTDKGKIIIHKGFSEFNAFYKCYRALTDKHPESHFVLHMRVATDGIINRNNCHPFRISKFAAVAHNGMISFSGTSKTAELSDTRNFVENYLSHLPEDFREKPLLWKSIKELGGYSSKFVFLFADNKFGIIGDGASHWNKDNTIWYSNKSYECSKSYKTYPSHATRNLDTLYDNYDEDNYYKNSDSNWNNESLPQSASFDEAEGIYNLKCFRCLRGVVVDWRDYSQDTKFYCTQCYNMVNKERTRGYTLCCKCHHEFVPMIDKENSSEVTCEKCAQHDIMQKDADATQKAIELAKTHPNSFCRNATESLMLSPHYKRFVSLFVTSPTRETAETCSSCSRLYFPRKENCFGMCQLCTENKVRDRSTYNYCKYCHLQFRKSSFQECTHCFNELKKGRTPLLLFREKQIMRWGRIGLGLEGFWCTKCKISGEGKTPDSKGVEFIDLRTGLCKTCYMED